MIQPTSPSLSSGDPDHGSPFPGMDPWVEDQWGDMHTSMTAYARDELQPNLPDGLRAQVEEYMSIAEESSEDDSDDLPAEDQLRRPDVSVVENDPKIQSVAALGSAYAPIAVAVNNQPMRLKRYMENPIMRAIRIIDVNNGSRLVTSIEFLSPSNKRGEGHRSFREKQRLMMAAGVNIVEIDLLRTGDWAVSIKRDAVPDSKVGPYRACVIRAPDQSVCDYYQITLEEKLPTLSIPLRYGEQEIALDLQPLFEQAYRNGAYRKVIDYSRSPRYVLEEPDARIAKNFVGSNFTDSSS